MVVVVAVVPPIAIIAGITDIPPVSDVAGIAAISSITVIDDISAVPIPTRVTTNVPALITMASSNVPSSAMRSGAMALGK